MDTKYTEYYVRSQIQKGYFILGREQAQQMNYIQYPETQPPTCTFTPETSIKAIAVESDKRSSSQVEKGVQGRQMRKKPKDKSKPHKEGLIEPIVPDIEWRDHEIIVNDRAHKIPTTKECLLKKFADVFQGFGRLPGPPYHIRLKENYTLVQHPSQSVPVGMQSAYKAEFDRVLQEDIITEVNQHTEWVNCIVPVSKPDGSIRLCLDPKHLNKAVKKKTIVLQDIEQHFTTPFKSLYNNPK